MPHLRQSALVAVLLAATLPGSGCIGPSNEFDPNTARDQQSRGEVFGHVVLPGRSFDASPVTLHVFDIVEGVEKEVFGSDGEPFKTRTSDQAVPEGLDVDDAAGTFAISGLLPGQYRVFFDAEQNGEGLFRNASVLVTVGVGERVRRDLEPARADLDDVIGAVLGTIEGAEPGRLYVVTLVPRGAAAGRPELVRTLSKNESGAFAFAAVPPGEYAIEVGGDAYAPNGTGSFSVQTAQTANVPPLRLTVLGRLFSITDWDPTGGAPPFRPYLPTTTAHVALAPLALVTEQPPQAFVRVALADRFPADPHEGWQAVTAGSDDVEVDLDADLPDGEREVVAQLRLCFANECVCDPGEDAEGCAGFRPPLVSGHASLSVVVDRAGPEPVSVSVDGDDARGSEIIANCARFGADCPPAAGAAAYSPLVEVRALDVAGRVRGFAVTLDDEAPPTTFQTVDALQNVADWVGDAPALDATDGEHVLRVWAQDRAGNVAVLDERPVRTDVTPLTLATPAIALDGARALEDPAAAGVTLQAVTSASFAVRVLTDDEPAATARVRQVRGEAALAGAAITGFAQVGEAGLTLAIDAAHRDSSAFVVDAADDAGNVVTTQEVEIVRWDRGSLVGSVSVEGANDATGSKATLFAADGVTVVGSVDAGSSVDLDTSTSEVFSLSLGSDGALAVSFAPAGDYVLVVEAPAPIVPLTRAVTVRAAETDLLAPLALVRPRAGLRGAFALEGREGTTNNAGIQVTLFSGGGDLLATTTTLPDGSYNISNVPAGLGYSVIGFFPEFVQGEVQGIAVIAATDNVVADDGTGTPTPVVLRELVGDFTLCAPAGGGLLDEACAPLFYTNLGTVQVGGIDLAGFTEYRISTTSFEPDDASPAFVAVQLGAGDVPVAPTVAIGPTEGNISVYLQLSSGDGNVGEVLSVDLLFDQTPPTSPELTVLRGEAAFVDGYTRDSLVRLRLNANAGSGAPLGDACARFADAAPTSSSGATCGLHNTLLTVPLEDLQEGVHTGYAFSCDRAGNCTTSPVSGVILYDATPPVVPAAPGGVSPTTGAGWGPALGASQFDGVRFHVNTRTHNVRVDAGTAVAPAPGSGDIAEVVAVRLAPDAAQLASSPFVPAAPFTTVAGVMLLPSPAYVGAEGGDFAVHVQLADAAGNLTAGALSYNLRLDTAPPRVGITVPGTTTDANGALAVSVTDLDNEVLTSASFFTDAGQSLDLAPASPQVTLGGTLQVTPAALPALSDGEHNVSITATDRAGNTALASRVVLVDREPPAAPTPTFPLAGAIITTQTPTYRWDAVTGTAYFVLTVKQGASVVRGPSAVYSNELNETVALPRGSYTWEVEAFDGAGNASGLAASFPVSFVVDDAAPTGLASLALTAGGTTTADTTPTLQWTAATDPNGQTPQAQLRYTIQVYNGPTFDSLALAAEVVGGSGTRTFTPAVSLADGAHAWRVTVQDNGGNSATVDGPTFSVDSTPPLAVTFAAIGDPAGNPVVVRWTAPSDPDRVGVRIQLATSEAFSTLLLDTLQTDQQEDITASLSNGVRYYIRGASEDALGNRTFLAAASFVYDANPPALAASPIVVLDPSGTPLLAADLITDRNVSVRLNAGVAGESVRALVSNEPGCALPVSFQLDTDNLPNTVAWTLAAGGAAKRVYVRFVDDAGNSTACVGSAIFRSTGTIEGQVLAAAGTTGLTLAGNEALGVLVRLSGGGLGADERFTVTNADGVYRFTGVPISPTAIANTLQMAKPELGTGSTTMLAVADQEVSAPDVTMTLRSSTVSGTALLHTNFPAVGGSCAEPTNHSSITLSLVGTAWTGAQVTRSTSAATNGTWSFTGVPGGNYQLSASRDGYVTQQGTVNLQVNGGTNITGQTFALYDRVAPSAPLLGLASAAVTAQPTATIDVDLASTDSTAPTSNFYGYSVTRVATVGGAATLVANLGVLSPQASYTLPLVSNRTNRFVFTARDCGGNDAVAAEVFVRHDGIAPGVPTDVRIDNRDGAIRVSWTKRPAAEGVAGYRVYYGGVASTSPADYSGEDASQGASPLEVGDVDATLLTGLTNQSQFYVTVQAIDDVEDPGPNGSNLSSPVVAAPAAYPIDIAATVTVPSGNDATVAGDRIVTITASQLRVYTYDTRGELSLRGSLAVGGDRVWGSPDHHVVYVTSKTDYAAGIKVVDVSNPTAPALLQTFTTATRRLYHLMAPGRFTNSTGTRREHIYAVYQEEGTNLIRIHSFRTAGAGSPSLIDNANPLTVPNANSCLTAPSTVSSEDISELHSAGDLAFLVIGSCLKVLKLNTGGTAFTQTDEVGRSTAHGIRGVTVDPPYVYAMDQDLIRVHLLDRAAGTLSDPTTPGAGDALTFDDGNGEFNIGSMSTAGVFVAVARQNLAVYDTSTLSLPNVPPASRTAPGLIGTAFMPSGGNFQSAKLEPLGGQAMLFRRESTSGVVRILELGGPRIFERSADISTTSRGRGGTVRGATLARLVTNQTELQLYDLRDAAAPGLLAGAPRYTNGSCSGSTGASCMLIERDGSYAYVTNNSGDPVGGSVSTNHLLIFDIADPSNPTVASVTNLGTGSYDGFSPGSGFPSGSEANSIAAFDDIVAVGIDYPGVATPQGYVHFLDVRNRWAPTLVNLSAGFDTAAGDVRAMAIDSRFAYVGKGDQLCVVRLFTAANAFLPAQVGCQSVGSAIQGVALRGTELLVARSGQLLVFDVTNPTTTPLPQLLSKATAAGNLFALTANGLSSYGYTSGLNAYDFAYESSGRQNLTLQPRGAHLITGFPYDIAQSGFFTFLFNENTTTRLVKQQ